MNGPGGSLPFLFGPYELLMRLGHGGMGQIFLARRATVAGSSSLCVLKTLKPELADDGEYVGRFLDEARTVMQLRHSSISHVFDAGQHDGTYYMAMEHLSGVTARELCQASAQGGLDPGLALLVVEDVLGALAYAHAFQDPLTGAPLGVVHRDVSPHNVIVTFEGEVKLIDFGLAESVLKQEHTESQVVMGKISYMSPEQARGEDVDAACDQFAAAVMLYELLAGERFYGKRNNAEIWGVVGFGGFRPDRFGELPASLSSILERALCADPRGRFPDCRAFQVALEALHAERYPRATRSRLRAFMQERFAAQQQAQQDALVRSAAIASEGQQHTQSASRPSAYHESASLSSGVETSSSSTTELPPADERARSAAGVVPSESLRVPRSRAPLALVTVGAVLLLGVVGYWSSGVSLGDRDESATVSTAAEDAAEGSLPPAPHGPGAAALEGADAPVSDDGPAEDAVTASELAPAAAEAHATVVADAGGAPRGARALASKRPRSDPPRQRREPAEPPSATEPEEAPPPEPTPARAGSNAMPDAPMTNAEALDVVKRCDLGCAPLVLALPGVKDGSVLQQRPNAVVLNCARLCLAR